jgi:hypothetical protein
MTMEIYKRHTNRVPQPREWTKAKWTVALNALP